MKRMVIFVAGMLSLASLPAFAADLPVKARPIVAVESYSWNNCYLGANGGWKWGRFGDSVEVPATTGTIPGLGTFTAPLDRNDLGRTSANSGAFGGQIGCRWETQDHWVFGLEADADWTNLRATSTIVTPSGLGTTFVPGDTFVNRLRWESSVRGVVGHAWDRVLVYVTGGIAFGGVSMDANFIPSTGVFTDGRAGPYPPSAGSDSRVLVGGTFGGGLAYALSKNWEIGAEYRYTAFSAGSFGIGQVAAICGRTTAVPGGIGCFNQDTTGHKDLRMSEILFKLNYRFDWGSPIVAKY